jgi:Apea-like HEPN/ApeA N-terminal domain 1
MTRELSPLGEFEIRGQWWLPGTPDLPVSGRLHYEAGNWVRLDLDSSLKDHWVDQGDGFKAYSFEVLPTPVVLGTALDGTECTLFDAAELGKSITAGSLLIGGHFGVEAEARFESASVPGGTMVMYSPRRIVQPAGKASHERPINSAEVPLPFGLVKPVAERAFNEWFSRAEELGPVHQLLIETFPPYDAALQSLFLRLAQAIEVFHRRSSAQTYVTGEEYAQYYDALIQALPEETPAPLKERVKNYLKYGNQYSLKSVVKRLVKTYDASAQHALRIEDPDAFALLVANTRNCLTHLSPTMGPVASTASDYFEMINKLRALLYGAVARSLGFAISQCLSRVPS